ncbi:MAG: hypothetical protein AB2417_03125 [Clostridiaceae bacterium]
MKFAFRSLDLKKKTTQRKGLLEGDTFKEVLKFSKQWRKKPGKNILKRINKKTNKNVFKMFKKLFK